MNGLVRNITLVTSLGLGAAILLLAVVTWINTKAVVVETIESQAESLAHSVEKALGADFHTDLAQSLGADLQEVRRRAESRRIDANLKQFTLDTPVPKITVYNADQTMVYSSEPELIGADWNRHPEVLTRYPCCPYRCRP